ncbi:MAG: APC family permease [Coriobacteriia bacterium]|nr:APC family permease [Coriobacteriia bacterium]MBN2839867.1 APC family permease [Coriobacteriia bacterium]
MAGPLKRFLLGDPLHNREAMHQRLSNPVALAVFSSDALSSVAYAPHEIMLMLALAGTAALSLTLPIAVAIGVLLVIVVLSYRQTIREYPGGGGSYIVAKENLGTVPGLVAGASLLVDYILTVAVSISAAVAAITSARPELLPYTVPIAIGFVLLLAVANLRGVKESGTIFAGPTFAFIALIGFMVVAGLVRFATGDPFTVPVPAEPIEIVQSLGLFLVLKAFASGCTAMTGVEAIANGVQAFRQPEGKNASITLTWMAGILLFLFTGIVLLSTLAGVQPSETETVISQLSRAMFGTGWFYYVISASVAAILVLAANTAYADFPRLSSFVADDDFLPHQLRDRGHRLVFSNGIILLTIAAIVLLVAFGGVTTRLIPLYAVGVFLSFTLSQAGMVRHHLRIREQGWQRSLAINAVGATATGVVTAVIATAKFAHGAWIVLILIPAIVALFLWVRRQYDRVRKDLAIRPDEFADLDWQSYNRMHNHVIVLVKSIDRRLVRALRYARTLQADRVEALYVDIDGTGDVFRRRWDKAAFGIKLTIIESPYREILSPIMEFIRAVPRPTNDHVVTVILPEYAPENVGDAILHDQTSLFLKQQLFGEPGVILTDVPYHINEPCTPLACALPETPRRQE